MITVDREALVSFRVEGAIAAYRHDLIAIDDLRRVMFHRARVVFQHQFVEIPLRAQVHLLGTCRILEGQFVEPVAPGRTLRPPPRSSFVFRKDERRAKFMALYRQPVITGRSGSPPRNVTSTSIPIRGTNPCAPHELPAQDCATRISMNCARRCAPDDPTETAPSRAQTRP